MEWSDSSNEDDTLFPMATSRVPQPASKPQKGCQSKHALPRYQPRVAAPTQPKHRPKPKASSSDPRPPTGSSAFTHNDTAHNKSRRPPPIAAHQHATAMSRMPNGAKLTATTSWTPLSADDLSDIIPSAVLDECRSSSTGQALSSNMQESGHTNNCNTAGVAGSSTGKPVHGSPASAGAYFKIEMPSGDSQPSGNRVKPRMRGNERSCRARKDRSWKEACRTSTTQGRAGGGQSQADNNEAARRKKAREKKGEQPRGGDAREGVAFAPRFKDQFRWAAFHSSGWGSGRHGSSWEDQMVRHRSPFTDVGLWASGPLPPLRRRRALLPRLVAAGAVRSGRIRSTTAPCSVHTVQAVLESGFLRAERRHR